MKEVALDCIHAGHLEKENHHPEHEKASVRCVDIHKLFADRLSVHLQKDPIDEQNGWDINMNFIPSAYRDEWETFVAKYKAVDLYAALSDALLKQWLGDRIWDRIKQVHWCKHDVSSRQVQTCFSNTKNRDFWLVKRILVCDWWMGMTSSHL